jgi:hypothetical protein
MEGGAESKEMIT